MHIEPRIGGSFRFIEQRNGDRVEYRGEYVEIVPHRRLAFTLCNDPLSPLACPEHPPPTTRVRIDIAGHAQGCALTLSHDGLPRDRVTRTRQRWTGILYGLDATLGELGAGLNG